MKELMNLLTKTKFEYRVLHKNDHNFPVRGLSSQNELRGKLITQWVKKVCHIGLAASFLKESYSYTKESYTKYQQSGTKCSLWNYFKEKYLKEIYFHSDIFSKMRCRMGKPTICIGENKGADQLCNNCTADQRLCFRCMDSTILLLLKSEISSF